MTSTSAPGGPVLIKVGGRPPLGRYLVRLWGRRHFAIELARSRFRAQNEADRLGVFWTVLGPLLNAAVYGVVFSLLLPNSSRPTNYIPYLVTGVFIFQYFSGCFAGGAKSVIGNMSLIRSLHFPRAVLPISLVLEQLYALVPMMAVLALLVIATGEPITLRWLLVPAALFLMTLFNLGISFIAARLTIHIRDLAQLIPFITRIIFYISGIFFQIKPGLHPDERTQILAKVLDYNPVHAYISLVRWCIVTVEGKEQVYADGNTWVIAAVWAVGLFVVGFAFFWQAEERYGRE